MGVQRQGVDRRSIEQLATCDFVRRRENLILVGQSGLGKSRILQALGHRACTLVYRVRYTTSSKLLQEFTAAMADGSFARKLNEYAQYELLLIDEFGFDRLEREVNARASSFYYRLLEARTGRYSTALATNIDFSMWGDYLGDPPLATAFLDRLVDGAVILKLRSEPAGVVNCWWNCEVTTHKCVAGKILTVTDGTERIKGPTLSALRGTHLVLEDGRSGQERQLGSHSAFRFFLLFIDSRKR